MRSLFERLWRRTPLLTALHSDDMDSFQTSLNDSAYDVNEDVSSDGSGWTILHTAAYLNKNINRMKYILLLLNCERVDKERTTKLKGLTASHVACRMNDVQFAMAFLGHHYAR